MPARADVGNDASPADAQPPGDGARPDTGIASEDAGTVQAATCESPANDAGPLGCAQAVCPAGTVCVQRDFDITSVARCVTIPKECAGHATCACMGAVAQACAETNGGALRLGCEDTTQGDASFLEFPCLCQ